MSLKLRLARAGTKKRPFYHVVIADARAPRDGRFIEKLGTYNPLLADNDKKVTIDTERARHWLGVGAQPTQRVARFLAAAGLMAAPTQNNPIKAKPGAKALERAEARRARAEAPAEAPAEAASAE